MWNVNTLQNNFSSTFFLSVRHWNCNLNAELFTRWPSLPPFRSTLRGRHFSISSADVIDLFVRIRRIVVAIVWRSRVERYEIRRLCRIPAACCRYNAKFPRPAYRPVWLPNSAYSHRGNLSCGASGITIFVTSPEKTALAFSRSSLTSCCSDFPKLPRRLHEQAKLSVAPKSNKHKVRKYRESFIMKHRYSQ